MKILLVRLRLIGDVVFTTPIVAALRHHYPAAHLAYVVEPPAEPIVRGNPHLDDVIVAPLVGGLRRAAVDALLGRELRRRRYDIAIDLHGGPRAAWLAWASRAPMRIGYRIAGRWWMYTHVVDRAPNLTPRHSVANQWDLLAPLGIAPGNPAANPVEMPDDPAAGAAVDARLEALGIDRSAQLVVVHTSPSNPFRAWPAAAFEALVVELARRDPRRRILLVWGASDAEAARRIADGARSRLGRLATAVPDPGNFDLRELRALVSRAAVYIGVDSGPAHVAATTRTPIVLLLGPTLPERSRPWRDPAVPVEIVDAGPLPCRPCHQRICEPGDFRCLRSISVERVLEAAERLLGGRNS